MTKHFFKEFQCQMKNFPASLHNWVLIIVHKFNSWSCKPFRKKLFSQLILCKCSFYSTKTLPHLPISLPISVCSYQFAQKECKIKSSRNHHDDYYLVLDYQSNELILQVHSIFKNCLQMIIKWIYKETL